MAEITWQKRRYVVSGRKLSGRKRYVLGSRNYVEAEEVISPADNDSKVKSSLTAK